MNKSQQYTEQKKQYTKKYYSIYSIFSIYETRTGKTNLEWQKTNQWLLGAKDGNMQQRAWGNFRRGCMISSVLVNAS